LYPIKFYYRAVILHGVSLIKEAFNHPGIVGRPVKEAGMFLGGGLDGKHPIYDIIQAYICIGSKAH